MDSDEDFKHYSSCYYDDDADRAFYPDSAQQQLQLDSKSWFDCDKTSAITIQRQQCPTQELMLDNIVTSSDKVRNSKNLGRWTDSVHLSRDLKCDADANSLRSVSTSYNFFSRNRCWSVDR